MQLYRFSPITTEEKLNEVWEYITEELGILSEKVLGEKLPVCILKVFPHYLEESDYLHQLIASFGPKAVFSSERNLYIQVQKEIKGQHIYAMGVRFVDPYRMQVGCGDYEVEDYEGYKEKFKDSPFVRDMGEKKYA